MADDVDRSPDYNAMALASHLAGLEQDTSWAMLSDFCEDCGEEIILARREAQPGCSLCTHCAELAELRHG